jgi:hypothetical protein
MPGEEHFELPADGIWPGQDKHGVYAKACAEFAESINWEASDVCFHWSQIALVRERFNGEPRAIAEFLAMRDVREALDCRGRDAS